MKDYKIIINGVVHTVSKEIYKLFTQEREKERYYNNKKRKKIKVDPIAQKVTFEESRVDSLDRLNDCKIQIADMSRNIEDYITAKIDLERALNKLTSKERYIIEQFYFQNKTDNEIAKEFNVTRQFINKLRKEILLKLHKLLKIGC